MKQSGLWPSLAQRMPAQLAAVSLHQHACSWGRGGERWWSLSSKMSKQQNGSTPALWQLPLTDTNPPPAWPFSWLPGPHLLPCPGLCYLPSAAQGLLRAAQGPAFACRTPPCCRQLLPSYLFPVPSPPSCPTPCCPACPPGLSLSLLCPTPPHHPALAPRHPHTPPLQPIPDSSCFWGYRAKPQWQALLNQFIYFIRVKDMFVCVWESGASLSSSFLSFWHGYFSSHHRFFSKLLLSQLLSLSILVFQLLTLLNREDTRREGDRVPCHQKMLVSGQHIKSTVPEKETEAAAREC